jgi:dihydrofolate reductase
MKKLIVLAVIGNDKAFRKEGCPLHNNEEVYNNYFRQRTDGDIMAFPEEIYQQLPDKSPPFPCRTSYIINAEHCDIASGTLKTNATPNLEALFEITKDDQRTIFVILNAALYEELFIYYKEEIDSVLVVEIDQPFKKHEGEILFDPPSPFEWRSLEVLRIKSMGKRYPTVGIHEYRKEPLHL